MIDGRTKSDMPVVLILAGGKGERFWPRSRENTPKQLQKVYSDKTLLEETLIRAKKITSLSHIYIGCNAALKKSILSGHDGLTDDNFIVEPEGKNTAPIIALAALQLEEKHPGAIHVILSADHYISNLDEFKLTIEKALSAAREGFLVTLGVKPSRPEIGYGYIESEGAQSSAVYEKISSFREKPGINVAMEYLESGRHYWNAGIFIWSGTTILDEFDEHAKNIIDPIRSALIKGSDALKNAYSELKSDPVDIAILEKSKNIVMVPASFIWDDVGSWLSLERICSSDEKGNVFVKGSPHSQIMLKKSSGNIVSSSLGMIALLGVKDLIIVEDGDVLFISSRERSGEIKELIADIRKNPALQKYLI